MIRQTKSVIDHGIISTLVNAAPEGELLGAEEPPLPDDGCTIAAIVCDTRMTVCNLVLVIDDLPGTATTTTSVVV